MMYNLKAKRILAAFLCVILLSGMAPNVTIGMAESLPETPEASDTADATEAPTPEPTAVIEAEPTAAPTTVATNEPVTAPEYLVDGNWLYLLDAELYAVIMGYTDPGVTELTIPYTVGGNYVAAIGSNAFAANKALATLTIHGNV